MRSLWLNVVFGLRPGRARFSAVESFPLNYDIGGFTNWLLEAP